MTAILGTPPDGGTFSFHADGSFEFSPDTCSTQVCFTYAATDGVLTSPLATACIDVNHAPVGYADQYYVEIDTTLVTNACGTQMPFGVLCADYLYDYDIDNDPLSVSLITAPQHASSFSLNADGTFLYTPAAGYLGNDTFTYNLYDGFLSTPVTVTITVEYLQKVIANAQTGRALAQGVEDLHGYETVESLIPKCSCNYISEGPICRGIDVNRDTSGENAGDVLRVTKARASN